MGTVFSLLLSSKQSQPEFQPRHLPPALSPSQELPRPPLRPRSPPLTLHSLPPELWMEISCHLPLSSLISLKLTTKHLYATISLPALIDYKTLPRCELTAIRRYTSSARHARQHRRRCLACNTLQNHKYFRDPTTPVCALEDALLTALVPPPYLPDAIQRRLRVLCARMRAGDARWVEVRRVWCAHDRRVVGWHVPACTCRCDSCAHVEVACLVRVARRVEVPRSWAFAADGKGIEEERWLEGERAPWSVTDAASGARTGSGEGQGRVDARRIVPTVTLHEAEEEINVLELSHASLLTLL